MRYLIPLLLTALLGCSAEDRPGNTDSLRIGGSSSARDVVEQILADFRVDHRQFEVQHRPSTHSGTALDALRNGELDLAYLTRDPTPEERSGLYLYPFARDPLVFAVHAGTGVNDLTVPQLRALYAGEVRNWRQLGGNDLAVLLLDRPDYTSPKVLLRGGPFANLKVHPEAMVLDRPELMDEALSTYPGALGYTSLRQAMAAGKTVRVLRIGGVYPSAETVLAGAYPLSRSLLFAARDPLPRGAKTLIDHVNSPTGRRILEKVALVPLRRELRIAVPPVRNIVALEVKYGGLARYLQERLGRPVELTHQPTYTDLTEAFRKNRIDAAFVGSFAYLVAHLEAGVEALARPDYAGVSHYRGVFFVRADSPYRSVEELGGTRLAHSGKTTTAGEIFPMYELKRRGLPPPAKFFHQILDTGSHEAALRALLEGRADVAAAKDTVWAEMLAEEPELSGRLRSLAESPPVPSNALAAGVLLSDEVKRQLRGLLLSMDQHPKGRKALQDMGAKRFLATSDEDYASLYEMVRTVADDLTAYFHYR